MELKLLCFPMRSYVGCIMQVLKLGVLYLGLLLHWLLGQSLFLWGNLRSFLVNLYIYFSNLLLGCVVFWLLEKFWITKESIIIEGVKCGSKSHALVPVSVTEQITVMSKCLDVWQHLHSYSSVCMVFYLVLSEVWISKMTPFLRFYNILH